MGAGWEGATGAEAAVEEGAETAVGTEEGGSGGVKAEAAWTEEEASSLLAGPAAAVAVGKTGAGLEAARVVETAVVAMEAAGWVAERAVAAGVGRAE